MDKWNREILRLAVPSVISNVTVPLLGLVDLAVVGHIGNEAYISAIAIGTMISMSCTGCWASCGWERAV